MQEQTSYEEKIIAHLRSKNGEAIPVNALAKKFKVGAASILALLNELAACGKVRHVKGGNKRVGGFYLPTETQINAERRMAESAKAMAPLKVDNYRRELYARLKAERDAIPSRMGV